jgi:hypothetical protein
MPFLRARRPARDARLGYNSQLPMERQVRKAVSRFHPWFLSGLILLAVLLSGAPGHPAVAELAGPQQEATGGPQEPSAQQAVPPPAEEAAQEAPTQDRAELLRAATAGARADVEKALSGLRARNQRGLAQALHAVLESENSAEDDSSGAILEPVGDLDGDGNLEYVYRWTGPIEAPAAQATAPEEGIWDLFLLTWDGSRWRVSELLAGEGLYDLHPLRRLDGSPGLAVVEDLEQMPFPVVFRFRRHVATLAWDSRDEESRYQGFSSGEVEFRDPGPNAPLEMLVAGKADPGLVHFPRAGHRGFGIATLYTWDGKAFVPRKTVYSPGEDYTFYRFVSALHLKDFRTAYGLIVPQQFLKGEDASLEAFRKYMESTLPEFLGDNLFEVAGGSAEAESKGSFQLDLHGHLYIYHPTYSNDGKFLLTGLDRRTVK